ncbi:DUF503 domain-containing protein [Candidatus Sumerlaeota bacterium]|nr:DUF503 domain-containing protein [Candidatus Sumerlaeota bacterium]
MHDPPSVVVGLMHVELHIPLCNSLKEKRSAVRPCLQHIRTQLNLAVAEVGDQDVWRSALVAMVSVSNDRTVVENTLNRARHYFETRRDLELVDSRTEIL